MSIQKKIIFARAKVYQILSKLHALEGLFFQEKQSDGFGYSDQ